MLIYHQVILGGKQEARWITKHRFIKHPLNRIVPGKLRSDLSHVFRSARDTKNGMNGHTRSKWEGHGRIVNLCASGGQRPCVPLREGCIGHGLSCLSEEVHKTENKGFFIS